METSHCRLPPWSVSMEAVSSPLRSLLSTPGQSMETLHGGGLQCVDTPLRQSPLHSAAFSPLQDGTT